MEAEEEPQERTDSSSAEAPWTRQHEVLPLRMKTNHVRLRLLWLSKSRTTPAETTCNRNGSSVDPFVKPT